MPVKHMKLLDSNRSGASGPDGTKWITHMPLPESIMEPPPSIAYLVGLIFVARSLLKAALAGTQP